MPKIKTVRLRAPGGLENIKLVEEDHPKPRPGELLVRIRASSLNFHDDLVVLGKIRCAYGRIPISVIGTYTKPALSVHDVDSFVDRGAFLRTRVLHAQGHETRRSDK